MSIAGGEASAVLNRVIGLGVEEPATRKAVRTITAAYAEAGVGRFHVHLQSDARPPELREWLEQAGLVRARGWMQFRRDTSPPPSRRGSDLRVESIGEDRAADFGRIAAEAFSLSEAAVPALAGLVGRPGWHVYLTFDGDEPAGSAACFHHEGVGWFDWAATRPAFRRRGSQGQLLHRRMRDAIDVGCQMMVTETGEAAPGDPQHFYKNILRAGFVEHRLRENFAPAS
jgi:hypothetical protein